MRHSNIAPLINAKPVPLHSTNVLDQLFSDLSPLRKSQIMNKLSPFCAVLDTLPLVPFGHGTASYSSGYDLRYKRYSQRKEFAANRGNGVTHAFAEMSGQDYEPYNPRFELAIFTSVPHHEDSLRVVVGRYLLREEAYVEMTTSKDEELRIILPYAKPISIESSRAISKDGANPLQNALLTIKTFLVQNQVEDAAEAAQNIDQQIANFIARFQQSAAALNCRTLGR